MINTQRLATVLLTVGLGLTSLPATGWAAPISLESGANVSQTATFAPLWAPAPSGDVVETLVELFAYEADLLSQYEAQIAAESFIGTACDAPC